MARLKERLLQETVERLQERINRDSINHIPLLRDENKRQKEEIDKLKDEIRLKDELMQSQAKR